MQPYFIVIAGPNGAGKSTTSKDILEPYGIEAFDWDKEFEALWKGFGYDQAVIDGVRESTNSKFQSHIENAFTDKISVAYETNFHTTFNIDLAKKAKGLGYITVLYFLALKNPKIAVNRVKERVRKGGHAVSKSTIIERFNKGLKLLDHYAIQAYDRVAVFNSSERFELQFVIENQLVEFTKNLDSDIINLLPRLKRLIQI